MGVEEDDVPQVDLTAERYHVRQESRKNLYTGKTYNSLENISQFFKERGMNVPVRPAGAVTVRPPRAGASAPIARACWINAGCRRALQQAALGSSRQPRPPLDSSGAIARRRCPKRPPVRNSRREQVQ